LHILIAVGDVYQALADPTRRRLYLFVVSRPVGAGRDDAAEAVGVILSEGRSAAMNRFNRRVKPEEPEGPQSQPGS